MGKQLLLIVTNETYKKQLRGEKRFFLRLNLPLTTELRKGKKKVITEFTIILNKKYKTKL